MSLLPNQTRAATRVLIDDFQLAEFTESGETEERRKSVSRDADFSGQTAGTLAAPWTYRTMPAGGKNISLEIVRGENPYIRLLMKPETSNYESAQVCQMLSLREGVRYRISCNVRLDTYAESMTKPVIVNFGLFHNESNTWYGPVDQLLQMKGGWVTYSYDHVPAYSGPWKLYIQLNGWGNFGNQVSISIDDFTCAPITN